MLAKLMIGEMIMKVMWRSHREYNEYLDWKILGRTPVMILRGICLMLGFKLGRLQDVVQMASSYNLQI